MKLNFHPTEADLLEAASESNVNQQIQMLLYRWRDRGGHYDTQMIEMVYEIMKIARETAPTKEDK